MQADIILRGYIGWNTRRALQVMDKVFPKVLSFFYLIPDLFQT
jgi:hypothetical protein